MHTCSHYTYMCVCVYIYMFVYMCVYICIFVCVSSDLLSDATHYDTLQHAETLCNILQHTWTR